MKAIRLNLQQNTPAWYAERFGNFTASAIYKLMTTGRSKTAIFSSTGITYIEETAQGRLLRPDLFVPGEMDDFIYRASCDSYATRYGHDQEDNARAAYERVTGEHVEDGAMYRHPEMMHLTASPDGLVGDDGLIEIKCPYGVGKFVHYAVAISDGPTLKATAPEYYWQVMAQMAVTGRKWCDFVVYDPAMMNPLHIARIMRDENEINSLIERVKLADDLANDIVNQLKPIF